LVFGKIAVADVAASAFATVLNRRQDGDHWQDL
jgi:hypothetical protein